MEYNTRDMPAAINAGFSLYLEYSITGSFNIVEMVTAVSLNGEVKAPNEPLANTAPITICKEAPEA